MHHHKQGDTLDWSGVATTNGAAVDLTGWSGKSQIRKCSNGALIEELTFAWLDASTGLMRIHSVNDTQSWPMGNASLDIQLTNPAGQVISTPTITLLIARDVSQ